MYTIQYPSIQNTKNPSNSTGRENCFNRPFARWHQFTTTTRILPGFAFLCKLRLLLLNPNGITKFKYERKNEKDSGGSSKMTPSCKWPIHLFAKWTFLCTSIIHKGVKTCLCHSLMIHTYREIMYLNAMITTLTQLIYLLGWGSLFTPLNQYHHSHKSLLSWN